MKRTIIYIIAAIMAAIMAPSIHAQNSMITRISEIEIYPEYVGEYIEAARLVGQRSVELEEGVICIYPMQELRDSCQIRIIEIYANEAAYKHHIQTEHFQTYKQGTLHMVKHLDLVDCAPLNAASLPLIFKKSDQPICE